MYLTRSIAGHLLLRGTRRSTPTDLVAPVGSPHLLPDHHLHQIYYNSMQCITWYRYSSRV